MSDDASSPFNFRLDFPPAQRDTAQALASLFAELIGTPIARLRPEHTISEIFSWPESDPLNTVEFIMALGEEFAGEIDDEFAADFEHRTFRELVEHLSRRKIAD